MNRLAQDITTELEAEHHFAKDRSGRLFVWQNGVYVPSGSQFIRRSCRAFCERESRVHEWSNGVCTEATSWISTNARTLWETPSRGVINLANGLLDVERSELRAVTHEHLSALQLPVAYDPAAKCPEWDAFTARVLPGCEDLFWETIGYILIPDSMLQKMILLFGEGGNGKSTLLRAIETLLGRHNVSNVSLHDLVHNRFATAELYGKLANICGDIPPKPISDTGILKRLTGGDEISGEIKHLRMFKFRPFAKLIFSANKLPDFSDDSLGFQDRLLIIHMTARIRGTERARPLEELLADLSKPGELSGALNKALEGWRRLRDNKQFSEQTSGKELRAVLDPVEKFLQTKTNPVGEIETTTLLDAFNQWARENGHHELNPSQFGKELAQRRPSIVRRRKGPRTAPRSVYKGISLVATGSKGSKGVSTF